MNGTCLDGYEVRDWTDVTKWAQERKLHPEQFEALDAMKGLMATYPYRVHCRVDDDGIRRTYVALAGCSITWQILPAHCVSWVIEVEDIWPKTT
jgi:hypothetical protein